MKMETSNSNLNLVFTCAVNNYNAWKTSQKSHGSGGFFLLLLIGQFFYFPKSWEFFCAACYGIIMYKSATLPALYKCSFIIQSPFEKGEKMWILIFVAFISFRHFSLIREKSMVLLATNRRAATLLN